MSGKHSRNKGARFEREVVNLIAGSGIKSMRVPLSGSTWMKGDVKVEIGKKSFTLECKARSSGFKFLYDNLGVNDALVLKSDRQQPLIVMSLSQLLAVVKEVEREIWDYVQKDFLNDLHHS